MKQRRFDLLHPSKSRLRHWLETGHPTGVGEHVEHCERCADTLVNLEPVFELDEPVMFRHALTAALTPPDDLSERVMQGVEARARADRELALFAGLFTIGVDTAKLMIADEPAPSHPPGTATPDDDTDHDTDHDTDRGEPQT